MVMRVTPADVYLNRVKEIWSLDRRDQIKPCRNALATASPFECTCSFS